MFGYLAIPRGPALRGAEPCQLRYWVTSSAKLMRSLAVSLFAASLAAPRFLWDGDWGGRPTTGGSDILVPTRKILFSYHPNKC